ncbi:hypothetical protein DFA_00123 [Cavenderia fasciculata]|uniref:Uncharacterized protein n=1 Tax=Cavenderia fasciculata TaxID=261658 RepID=F4PXN5_CACFS|nr:uncharacterized protein DFA_00123 [Cavenderia fasciculata]EGG19545.1 hypothetical protein DFA_00123 [Cavenderia fasciculata]|eukprot:XP_004357839.1 hypothetical protein DFA_00123 [Cavenderia fasciculata]
MIYNWSADTIFPYSFFDEVAYIEVSRNLSYLFNKNYDMLRIRAEKKKETLLLKEELFRLVWNNVVLRRLICAKIQECVLVLVPETIRLELFGSKSRHLAMIKEYKRDPKRHYELNGSFYLYTCPLLTPRIFKYYYEYVMQRKKRPTDFDLILDKISLSPRNLVDCWLFKTTYELLKSKGVPLDKMASTSTWANIVRTNNVELYNFVKTVLPLPKRVDDLKALVSVAAMTPETKLSYYERLMPISQDTKLLATLLDDLIEHDPCERYLEQVDYGTLVCTGNMGILQTLAEHAGDYIRRTITSGGSSIGGGRAERRRHRHTHLTKEMMLLAMRSKQINSVRYLHHEMEMPIETDALVEAARSCDLPFVIDVNIWTYQQQQHHHHHPSLSINQSINHISQYFTTTM